METFSYVKKDGSQGTVQAASADLAISSASDRAANSGVQRVPPATAPATDTSAQDAAPADPSDELLSEGRYKRKKSPLDKARAALEEQLAEGPEEPDEDAIRSAKREQAQGLIDQINANADKQLLEEATAGANREGRTRALNTAAGLGGSDFGSAAAQGTEDFNREQRSLIEEERSAKISAALGDADARASTEYATRREQYLKEIEGNYAKIQEFQKATRDTASANAKALAASGISLAAFKSKAPDTYAQLLEETGYDEPVFAAVYNASLPANQRRDYTYQKIGNQLYAISVDPATNKPVTEPIGDPEANYDDFMITADGTPIFVDMKSGTVTVAGAKGQFSKGGGGGGGTDTPATTASGKVSELFGILAGEDGYVSPSDFVDARRAWVAEEKGGTIAKFNSTFADYANPAHLKDYGLAAGRDL
jgi:hypothetical protein